MTKEEVIISLGLDNSALATGSKASRFILEESVQETMKSLKRLVGINMVEMVAHVIELWDEGTKKIAEMFYGHVMQEQSARWLDMERKKWRDLRTEMEKEDKARKEQGVTDERVSAQRAVNEAMGKARLDQLAAQRAELELEKRIAFEKGEQVKVVELEGRLKQNQLDTEAELTKEKEKQKEAADYARKFADDSRAIAARLKRELSAAANTANQRLSAAKQAGLEFTLEDMANSDFMQGTRWGNQANQIINLQQQARRSAMLGFGDQAKTQMNRADQMFEDLRKANPFLRDPLADLKMEAKKTNDNLEKLNKGVYILQANR